MPAGFNRLNEDDVLTALTWNDNVDSLEVANIHQHGAGIISGLVLSTPGGLTLACSAGVVQGLQTVALGSFTGTVLDAVTRYVWLTFTKAVVSGVTVYTPAFTLTSTSAQPGGSLACMGRYTAAAGAITLIETVNRTELARWLDQFTYKIGQGRLVVDESAGRVGVGKTPTQGALDVQGDHYISGDHHVGGNGFISGHAVKSYSGIQTLVADLALTKNSPNIIDVICSGANRKVKLPLLADMTPGHAFTIRNFGGSNNALVTDSTGATTIATLTPGDSVTDIGLIYDHTAVAYKIPTTASVLALTTSGI